MDPFELPEELPTDLDALTELHADALKAFDALKAIVEDGGDLSDDQLDYLRYVADAIDTVEAAVQAAEEAAEARRAEIDGLLSKVTDTGDDADAETEVEVENDAETEVEDEAEEREPALAADGRKASTGKERKTSFRGLGGGKTPKLDADKDIGWQMEPGAPGYQPGLVGFNVLADAMEQVRRGSSVARGRDIAPATSSFARQPIARLNRDLPVVNDSHALVAAIQESTDERRLPGGSLLASGGGWAAPSETLYDFCDVPVATDLLSLPEITIRRGGVRWPIEPDLTEIFESFQFFYTEPELEAVDADGNPTAVKEAVSIPIPDEFEEIRLNAVGYAVEAGILQQQGWPEVTKWFMENLVAEHFRALSRRSINDMVAGSTHLTIPAGTTIGATSSVLNSLALMATNLRLDRGLGRTATIEGVAPVWLFEVLRADLAMMNGVDTKNITDAQITGWLTARYISLQFVADWQSREPGLPGHIETVQYPGTVDVLLYPAGTWFRSMSPVIELGVQYPRELLRVNRYTHYFVEDAIAIGKRCNKSLNVTVPIVPNGAIGGRHLIGVPGGNGGGNGVGDG